MQYFVCFLLNFDNLFDLFRRLFSGLPNQPLATALPAVASSSQAMRALKRTLQVPTSKAKEAREKGQIWLNLKRLCRPPKNEKEEEYEETRVIVRLRII